MAGAAVLFPSLSEDAWISNSQKIADLMMSHFLISNYSQSYIYAGNVTSFPYILAVNHGNMSAIITETRNALVSYFSRFFQNVLVEVTETPNIASPSEAILNMVIQFTDYMNVSYSVGQIIQVTDSTFMKIVAISNG